MQITMGRALIALLASAVAQAGKTPASPPPVAAPVSFAGTWELKNPGVNEGFYTPFGTWFTATQDATTLVIESHILEVMDSYPGSPASLAMARSTGTTTIKLTGETRETAEPPPPFGPPAAVSPFQPPFSLALPVSSVTRSNWSGDELLIVTHTIYRNIGVEGVAPYDDERTERQAVGLDKDGRLVVDEIVIDDPFQGVVKEREPAPVSRQTVYYRRR